MVVSVTPRQASSYSPGCSASSRPALLSSLINCLLQVHLLKSLSLPCPGRGAQPVGAAAAGGEGRCTWPPWGETTHRTACSCFLPGGDRCDLPVATQVRVCSVQSRWKVQECDVMDFSRFNGELNRCLYFWMFE